MEVAKMLSASLLLVFVAGCAGPQKFVPREAYRDPSKGFSLPHPEVMEKSGMKRLVTFPVFMHTALYVEMHKGFGVWPVIVRRIDDTEIQGWAYYAGQNDFCDPILRVMLPMPDTLYEDDRVIIFNKDIGFAYTLVGEEIRPVWEAKQGFNPEKFEKEPEYRQAFFMKYGMASQDVIPMWNAYFSSKRMNAPNGVFTALTVNTSDWERFKAGGFLSIASKAYQMPDGENRIGWLPLEEFRKEATVMPGFDSSERVVRQASLPLAGLFTPFAFLAPIGGAVGAMANDDWDGNSARASGERRAMSNNIIGALAECRARLNR